MFRDLRRVLRPDGSAWLNLGDSYAGDKNKMLIPHRVAIALQSDGWVVRNDVTWVKPNPMPSAAKDRLNTTTEQIFHLTPEPHYWYDLDAIRKPHAQSTQNKIEGREETRDNIRKSGKALPGAEGCDDGHYDRFRGVDGSLASHPAGKNPGDVFEVTTKPFPDAHFAVYPPELCDKPLKATCPPTVCAECGSPYEREVERTRPNDVRRRDHAAGDSIDKRNDADFDTWSGQEWNEWKANNPDEFKGWNPTCDCDTDATEPGIALDTFAGAGTTLLKAKELGRKFIGVELNPKYADMARARVGIDVDDPSNVRDDAGQSGLEAYD